MPQLPEEVSKAWDTRNGPIVLVTVDEAGLPNAIYATCVSKFAEDTIVVADNYFDKTRANIKAGCRGAILFITKAGKSYQAKGTLAYHTEGPVFERMKTFHDPKHPGVAATVLQVEHVYSGAEKLM